MPRVNHTAHACDRRRSLSTPPVGTPEPPRRGAVHRGGVVAWWRGGVVAWWRGGVVARWHGGVVAWWRGGMVAWRRGGVVAR